LQANGVVATKNDFADFHFAGLETAVFEETWAITQIGIHKGKETTEIWLSSNSVELSTIIVSPSFVPGLVELISSALYRKEHIRSQRGHPQHRWHYS
jgi:hypothetical protein